MDLLSGNWLDSLPLLIAVAFALYILYHLVHWLTASRNYRDSADEHANSCLHALSWGCWLPLALVGLLVIFIL